MTGDIPAARQCTMPGCSAEKVDPTNQAGLCSEHGQRVSGESDEENAGEPASGDSKNTPDGDDNGSGGGEGETNAQSCLADAIEWFHLQLDEDIEDHTDAGEHPERPTTAREWFADVRGFEGTTIDEKQLGWVPPRATDRLVAFLHSRGHDREDMLSTGLFTEDLRLLWHGRYVFTYFDRNGEPAYAIARCTGDKGGGDAGYDGHPADFLPGKYAKLAHRKEYVDVDEPIYGLGTLDRDGPVLITEGVADAIRAHEAGYACLSPVTTQFKHKHREALADELEAHGRDVYVVQDTERPPCDVAEEGEGWDALALEQFGPGLKGGVRTAAFLSQHDIDAYVAELPRSGLDKVDLDDYLGTWSDTLTPILASAKPACEHPAYEPDTRSRTGSGRDQTPRGERESSDIDHNDLTEEEVEEALSHVSSSLHYDDWIQLGYAVHDWDSGPTGRRVFENWSRKSPKWEDPQSSNAVDWIWENARQGGQTTVATLVYRAVQGGWSPPRPSNDDAEPATAAPLALLDKLEDDEARRVARQHGLEWPDTSEARTRLRDRLMTAMRNGERTVLDAPTALGKSFTTATEPWLTRASATGQQPVVHFHETREARDQAADHSESAGVDYRVLLGRSEACPVAAGDHDPKQDDGENDRQVITMDGTPGSQWFEAVCDGRGVPFSVAHRYLAEHNDQDADLPCCAGETQCLALSQWDGIPRDDDGNTTADVIHATHQFAMVPGLRNHVNAVFDERPDFAADLSTRRIQQAVTAFLKHIDAPVTNWETFVSLAESDDAANGTVGREQNATHQAIDAEPDPEWYMSDPNAHTIAPALTRAIWYALRGGEDTNGRFSTTIPHEPPRLDADANDDDGWNRVWLSVVLNSDHTVQTVRTAPDMSAARSVVGLDAHPTPELWQANLGEHMTLDRVLDVEERRLWRRLERGLTVVQVGDATRPFTSGEYFNRNATEEFVTALRDRFGDDFQTVVTAGSVEQEHQEILQQAGVSDPETMHFGEEKSRGDFGGERVGLVNGCIDPGDDYVLDLLAELDLDAEPEVTECGSCSGDGCTNDPDCRDGYRRAHGREFVGDDADAAGALLGSVRENHVAQGAGRYARDASGDGGAVVFVRTNATPPGYVDLTVPGVQWVPTETQASIFDELSNCQHATAAELADAVDCTKEHVRSTLVEFHERGIIHVRENAGDHGAHLYRALAGVSSGVGVELEDNETTNDGVWCSYTWSLAVSAPVDPPTATRTSGTTTEAQDRPNMQVGLTSFGDTPPPE